MLRSVINQVSDAVRILRWNRDVSARATHLKAADGNVPFATHERKYMSTKTVLKRVALVAVAALAIGGVSAVSANAVANLSISGGYTGVGTQTGSAIAGPANSTSVTAGGVAEYVTISGGTFASGVTSATLAAAGPILVQTPSVGTITVSGYAQTGPGVFSATVTDTVTITVLAAPAGTVYNHSTAFIGAVGADVTVDAAQTAPQAASNTAIAQITVSQYSSTDGSVRLNDANTNAVVVSISGAGLVGTSAATRGPAAAVGAGTANSSFVPNIGVQNFYVYPSGQAGTGTITVSVNGAVVATKTVTFTGTFAAYTTASTQSSALGIGASDVWTFSGLDANKNAATITGATTATSSNTGVVTAVVGGSVAVPTVTVTGVASGTATVTITNASTSIPAVVVTYTVTKNTAKTVSIAFDKSSYAPGEKITLTVSAVDSNGAAVSDGAKALFSAAGVTANVNLVGALPVTNVTLAGGKATYTLYAPFAAGNIVVTGSEGAATDNVIANGTSAAASLSASATVVADTSALDAANAAADAAAEATDAANAATDAANAAADAADSATSAAQDAADQAGQALAAVNTLATSVAALIAGIKAQITSLTNLIVKIQKKVKA